MTFLSCKVSPQKFLGGSDAHGHGMVHGDASPSGFELGFAESQVPPLTPRHFPAGTSLPPSIRDGPRNVTA